MQLTNRVFVLLVLLRQWAQFHVFVDMFPCKTKMFIWGTSQRIVPAVAVQLTNSHLLCPALFFLFGLFSTVGAPSWIGTSCLVYLLCCLVYDRGIFPAVYWAMWKHGWTGSIWDFGSDSQMLLIYLSLLRCHCFQFSTVWSRQDDLCKYFWAGFHVRQTASALQLDILITRILLVWSWCLGWGGIWTC